jgi:hypothetical protein
VTALSFGQRLAKANGWLGERRQRERRTEEKSKMELAVGP